MDARPQSTISQGGREPRISPRLRQIQILERAEQSGSWWQSRRQVARRLGVPDSSFRYCLRTHDYRCLDKPRPGGRGPVCRNPRRSRLTIADVLQNAAERL